MLKFLFGRYSPWVRFLELVGIVTVLIIAYRKATIGQWSWVDALYGVFLLQYLFIRACHHYSWYRKDRLAYDNPPRHLGIEVHFVKALVPTSYILSISALLYLAGFEWFAAIAANVLEAIIPFVNGILITFHLRDDDPMPVNYFTQNLYLQDKNRSHPFKENAA